MAAHLQQVHVGNLTQNGYGTWRIRVKTLQKWYSPLSRNRRNLELVLCDEEGSKIHAIVPHNLVQENDIKLREMEWVIISTFRIVWAIGVSDVVPNNHMIIFTDWTHVSPSMLVNNNLFIDLKIYTSVITSNLRNYLFDIIGTVVHYGNVEYNNSIVFGPNYPRFTFRMKDQRNDHMTCVAWGEKAIEMRERFIVIPEDERIICILRWWKIDPWTGTEIHTVGSKSYAMINPDIEEAHNFMEELEMSDASSTISNLSRL